jgi:hypothetical protein
MTNLIYDKYKWPTIKTKFNMCNAPTKPEEMEMFVNTVVDAISGLA